MQCAHSADTIWCNVCVRLHTCGCLFAEQKLANETIAIEMVSPKSPWILKNYWVYSFHLIAIFIYILFLAQWRYHASRRCAVAAVLPLQHQRLSGFGCCGTLACSYSFGVWHKIAIPISARLISDKAKIVIRKRMTNFKDSILISYYCACRKFH